MDSEVVQALIVLLGVLVESGLFYVVVRKVWKSSRLEAALMAIGLTLLFCVAALLCRWGSENTLVRVVLGRMVGVLLGVEREKVV
jgi:hypothetical protein